MQIEIETFCLINIKIIIKNIYLLGTLYIYKYYVKLIYISLKKNVDDFMYL